MKIFEFLKSVFLLYGVVRTADVILKIPMILITEAVVFQVMRRKKHNTEEDDEIDE